MTYNLSISHLNTLHQEQLVCCCKIVKCKVQLMTSQQQQKLEENGARYSLFFYMNCKF